MNDWMVPEFQWDDAWRPDRGKVLTPEQLAALPKFQRYVDRDGDGIPWRTLPGDGAKGAYFTRGSGHNQFGGYTEDSAEYQLVVDRLKKKHEHARALVPPAVLHGPGDREIGIVSIGSCDAALREALARLAARGVQADYLRIRAFPFGEEVERFLASHATVFVVEQNRDAQLRSLLVLETAVEKAKLRSVLHYSGLPPTAGFVVDAILRALGVQSDDVASARVAVGETAPPPVPGTAASAGPAVAGPRL
jgi:2-oxoglutarate ferredoxin oxidoreductase subunit alpha